MTYKMKGFSGFKQTTLNYGISEDINKKIKNAEFNRKRAEDSFISGQEITGKLGDKIAILGQTFQDAADKYELGGGTVEHEFQGIDPVTGKEKWVQIGKYLENPEGVFTEDSMHDTKSASTGITTGTKVKTK